MPDTSAISPVTVSLGGGLILDKDDFSIPPGAAVTLQNFEPSIKGGYRRLTGSSKFDSNQVNGTSPILGVKVFNSGVLATSGNLVKFSTGSGWSSSIATRTSAGRYKFDDFNFTNAQKIVMVDDVNQAATYDGTTYTLLSSTGAPADPSSVAVFREHIFFAGMSSNPQEIVFTAPFLENDFTTANGAGSIKVDTSIVELKVFRDALFIFGKDKIYRLTGTSVADWQVVPVTRTLGCADGFSVQEIGGDLLFLSPDGLRTIAATARIGDVELGTVSKPIQPRIEDIGFDNISSVIVRGKSQYRLFYPKTGGTVENSNGILATLKRTQEGNIGFEYADIVGIKPSSMDSGFISNTEYIIEGGYDGYVRRQESGDTFDGSNVIAVYRSPDLSLGDTGIRKLMQRVILNYEVEGTIAAELRVRYDSDDRDVPQPAKFDITSPGGIAIFGSSSSTYNNATYGSSGAPIFRRAIEGSGFLIAVKLNHNSSNNPFTLHSYQLEFTTGGRR
tara:strand:- start:7067 stop:8575 length:1509 start_codon:yes stop_codon:yes gene_type:complete